MKRLLGVLVAALVLAAAPTARASHPAGLFTKTDAVATMDDGVGIATTTYIPFEHLPPGATFPSVVLFHGLGGNRQSLDAIARIYAQRGYAVLTFDFRGHGESGGLFSGLGARELADVAILRERWLPERIPSNGIVGAWGISLGGGAALRSVAEGEPFAAVQVVETWTDLYEALAPQNLPKTGAIFQFLGLVPRDRQTPELLALGDAVARRDTAAMRAFAQQRSSRELLGRGFPPTLIFQGRRDFAFGLEQGVAGFQRLSGPRRLYIGPFGHAPSRFPGADFELLMQRSLEWFDRYLLGMPNGVESRPPIELVADPPAGAPRASQALPPTVLRSYRLPGRATIGSAGKFVRRVRAGGLLETFGAPVVRLRASSTTGWPHLVAVLVARTRSGEEIVVSEGGVPISLSRRPRAVTIRLISQVTKIPAGSTLELTLAGTSTAQHPANLLYLVPVPQRARIAIRDVRLQLPVLRTPVSR